MNNPNSIVYIVDDDSSVRDAISNLLESVGLRAQTFGSTEEFLAASRTEAPGCLVLDVMLPGMRGLEFQEMLKKNSIAIPIIFITAHGDIPMTSKAMKAGAIEFLANHFPRKICWRRSTAGCSYDAQSGAALGIALAANQIRAVKPSRREVMDLVVTGIINKQIADNSASAKSQ